jgi:cell fate regulator YaaT (PSP1 superfamily)
VPIHPLPQFEEDLAIHLKEKEDREAYERLNAPTSIVVRFGYMRMVGEFPYTGEAKPGCGSKLVVRTQRGTEIGEMLTSTCPNSGCSKSVSRKEMLEYIENSGGRQYPFYERGKVLRIATPDDLNAQEKLEQQKNELRMIAKRVVEQSGLEMQIIEAEPLLGGERVVVYFGAEDRIDFRDLVQVLQQEMGTKVELRQIGARDEARITADYERCGQYCCCKNFLKVLRPVSMKSAKVQKATLDPLKISGRCGRLMCCLRYEDETYEELRKNLPHRKSRVGTPDGDGIVMSTQILTQLALVRLDDGTEAAFPIENLTPPVSKTAPERDARPARSVRSGSRSGEKDGDKVARTKRAPRGARTGEATDQPKSDAAAPTGEAPTTKKKRKRRKRRRTGGESAAGGEQNNSGTNERGGPSEGTGSGSGGPSAGPSTSASSGPSASSSGEDGDRPKKKKRRRRRRRSTGEGGPGNDSGSGPSSGGGSGGTGDS